MLGAMEEDLLNRIASRTVPQENLLASLCLCSEENERTLDMGEDKSAFWTSQMRIVVKSNKLYWYG